MLYLPGKPGWPLSSISRGGVRRLDSWPDVIDHQTVGRFKSVCVLKDVREEEWTNDPLSSALRNVLLVSTIPKPP